jgi:beta-galactosidase/beta-glucuronidase
MFFRSREESCQVESRISKPLPADTRTAGTRREGERDKNHPSAVIWSAGNKAGPGPNIAAVIEQGKKLDPTRSARRFVALYPNVVWRSQRATRLSRIHHPARFYDEDMAL